MRLASRTIVICIFESASWLAGAQLRLPRLFSEHMVMQRETPLHVWGWSNASEQISVSFHGQNVTTRSNDLGQWSLYLAPEAAGGPYQLTVHSTDTLTISDILVGDVWLAAGQSNMELPLKGIPDAPVKGGPEAVSSANQPKIRLLRLGGRGSAYPLNDIDASWTLCTPETAGPFSAVAYFFGREIQSRENIPIGLIDSSWGGTFAEAWLSLDALTSDASLMPVLSATSKWMDEQADIPLLVARDKRENEAAIGAKKPALLPHSYPSPSAWAPGTIYNAMIAPLTPFPIKGVIWYQGESNSIATRAPMYAALFSALITDWRAKWQQGNFPFLFVQIATFGTSPGVDLSNWDWDWGTVRDAQRRALTISNTAMAVTLDVGDPTNVHPADKETVGHRLALAARALAYGDVLEYSGPLLRQAVPMGTEMFVSFEHAKGLTAKGRSVTGFEVAGKDQRFFPASARISENHVYATSPKVPDPVYVRYGWGSAPEANLYNSTGLPASTFTTEERPLVNSGTR